MTSSASYPDLRDASVFISGGGSGIGASLTKGFLQQGARVGFIGRSDYSEFCDEMERETGIRPLWIQGDVTKVGELRGAIDKAEAAHGPLDVLVNNAANDQRFDSMEVTEEDWHAQIDVNLSHFFFASQRAAQSMKGRGGRIVNISSITYMNGAPGMVPYVTSNGGVTALTRSLAREWGPEGIRINAMAPGMVLTDKQLEKWISEEDIAEMQKKQCLKVRLQPDDMIGPVLFLASEASGAVAGQCLPADAGVVVTG